MRNLFFKRSLDYYRSVFNVGSSKSVVLPLYFFCNKQHNHKYLLNNLKPLHRTFSSNVSESPTPTLSEKQVNQILRENENRHQFQEEIVSNWNEAASIPSTHAILSVDSNHLASNSPIEDSIVSAKCLFTNGFLFGVFDGHGGPQCSQVVSKRLFDYIAASLLPRSELHRIIDQRQNSLPLQFTQYFNNDLEFTSELSTIFEKSLLKWCEDLIDSVGQEFSMEDALSSAFVRLDEDMGNELIDNFDSPVYNKLVQIAISGSVACVAHIDGPNLHIANAGDCGAVLGEVAESHGGWIVERLTNDHNWENSREVKRILSEHPIEERTSVIQNQRLLGMLMPLRAFGDYRFKWDVEKLKKYFGDFDQETLHLTQVNKTPPYLTVTPEITYHRLNPHEKFLIIGSDGLWESLGALDIVTMVGHYMSGQQTLKTVELPRRKVSLGEILNLLRKRSEGLKHKPVDTNAATHLIRHCLGSTEEGLDNTHLVHSLSLPANVRRYFRDDISIHVIFFDSNFVRVCPTEL